MKIAAITAIIYGALVAAGGVMGYVKKGSVASLVAGGASGLILIDCGLAMRNAGASASGAFGPWIGAFIVTLLLLGRFGPAFLKNREWMPGGTMALLSILALIGLIAGRK